MIKTISQISVESLESRSLLTLSTPNISDVFIEWGQVGGHLDRINLLWRQAESNASFVAQWSESRIQFVDDSDHTLAASTYDPFTQQYRTTQLVNAGQKYWYRVKAVIPGVDESDWTTPVSPLMPQDDSVAVSVTSVGSGGIQLSWNAPGTLRTGAGVTRVKYQFWRKLRGDAVWGEDSVSPVLENVTTWTDTTATPGLAYEYQLRRQDSKSDGTAAYFWWGYAYAGNAVQYQDPSRTALLVIDRSLFDTSIHSPAEVARFQQDLAAYKQDLIGNRWKLVDDLLVDRDADLPGNATAAHAVKNSINGIWNSTPGHLQAIVLLGHVPLAYSGAPQVGRGIHAEQEGSWPSDSYYGVGLGLSDPNAGWSTSGDYDNNAAALADRTRPQNRNVAFSNDGKFGDVVIPTGIQVPVGRIDFANMGQMAWTFPTTQPVPSNLDLYEYRDQAISPEQAEMGMFHRYFEKAHTWRLGLADVPQKALIDDQIGNEDRSTWVWSNLGSLVGAQNVEARDWETTLKTSKYLWAFGAGGGHQNGAGSDGVTSVDRWYLNPIPGNRRSRIRSTRPLSSS